MVFILELVIIDLFVVLEFGFVVGILELVIYEFMLILFKFKDEVLFIFKVVEEMLVFGDCVVLFLVEWGKCFDVVLFSYIYKYICYLGVVWENGIEGIVYV